MAEVHRETVHYSGHVQGVGFRYAAVQVAKEFEVSGFVQNLADGRVLLEAEGERAEVVAFLRELAERMHGHIRNTESVTGRGPRLHQGFVIR